MIQSDDGTDSVVYTSREFQPYGESFSSHYAFVGPCLFSTAMPEKEKSRPLIYISMGTVVNDRPDFYKACIAGLKELDADIVLSCGDAVRLEELGPLPENVRIYSRVDQLSLLARADAFLTHCGMNSVSESLYMATPMVLYPQTAEQRAVARRVTELGAGLRLEENSPQAIRRALETLLGDRSYTAAADACGRVFRSCSGPVGAAEFIETAPHREEPTV